MGLHFSTIVSWLVLLLSIQLFRVHSPSSASSISSSTLSSSRRIDTSPHPAASSATSDNSRDASVLRVATANLLRLRGLKSFPRIVGRGLNPPSMLELHQTQLSRQSSLPANIDRSFHHYDHHGSDCDPSTCVRALLNVPTFPETEDVVARVELQTRVDSRAAPEESAAKHRVDIYEILADNFKISRLIDSKIIDARAKKVWVSVDVQPAVENWTRGARYIHGLEVRLVPSNPNVSLTELVRLEVSLVPSSPNVSMTELVRLRRAADQKEAQWLQESFPLDMDYERGSGRSTRKTARNKKKTQQRHLKRKGDDSNQCRRHRLFVDFHEMGWSNWILSPNGYEVYYCDGECSFPLATHMNSTNHAVVQTLVNSFSPRAVPKACCVPTELSPIRMVYVNEWNQLTDKIYQDMVVEACGCR